MALSRAGKRRGKQHTAQQIKQGIASTKSEQAKRAKTANKYPRTEKQRIACSAAQKKHSEARASAKGRRSEARQNNSNYERSIAKHSKGEARRCEAKEIKPAQGRANKAIPCNSRQGTAHNRRQRNVIQSKAYLTQANQSKPNQNRSN